MTTPVAQPRALVPYRGATDAATSAWWRGIALRMPSWGLPDFAIAVGAWLLFSVISVVPLTLAADNSTLKAWALVLTISLPWIGLGGYPWLIAKLRGNGWVLDYGLRGTWADVAWGVGFGVLALTVAVVVGWLTTLVAGEFDSAAGDVARDLAGDPIALVVFALAVAFGAPFVEEVCYRGLLISGLLKRGTGRWMAVAISAALFALMHLEPVRFPLLFGIGLVLGFARVHRNNTTTPIVAHMVNNAPGAIGILFLT